MVCTHEKQTSFLSKPAWNVRNSRYVDPGRSSLRVNQAKAMRKSAAFVVISWYTHTEKRVMKEQTLQLSPEYITGFVDGEGCFCVSISKHKTLKRRQEVRLIFEIEVREDDLDILQQIQERIGCGNIYHLPYKRYEKWRPHVKLKVSNIKDIVHILIPFFDAHPLRAKKRKSYQIFRQIAFMVAEKKHLTDEGFKTIEQLRTKMNT